MLTGGGDRGYTLLGGEDSKYPLCMFVGDGASAFSHMGTALETGSKGAETIRVQIAVSGVYRLEVWGAVGGGHKYWYYNGATRQKEEHFNRGGLGGYSSGEVYLPKGTVLYLTAGGMGEPYVSSAPGEFQYYPGTIGGGGGVFVKSTSEYQASATGGGASDIRIGGSTLYDRVIVAGGGGGHGYVGSVGNQVGNGGHGGGENGEAGVSIPLVNYRGLGGTKTAGGQVNEINSPDDDHKATPGLFGMGGNGADYAGDASSSDFPNPDVNAGAGGSGGGGGGWYGGAGAYRAGGGGGSGWVYTAAYSASFITFENEVSNAFKAQSFLWKNGDKYYLSNTKMIGYVGTANPMMPDPRDAEFDPSDTLDAGSYTPITGNGRGGFVRITLTG